MMNFKDGYTPKGMYRFPFKMEMPLDIPASLAMSHKKDEFVQITYELRAQILPTDKKKFMVNEEVSRFGCTRRLIMLHMPTQPHSNKLVL